MNAINNKQYRFICELLWGGVPIDRKWAEGTNLFKSEAPKILEKYPMLYKSFFDIAKIEEEAIPPIRNYANHWFGVKVDCLYGIKIPKVMAPIQYALYQTFCFMNKYDFMDKVLEDKINPILLEVYEREKKIYLDKIKVTQNA